MTGNKLLNVVIFSEFPMFAIEIRVRFASVFQVSLILNRNSLNDIASDFLFPPVVKSCRAWVGVAGQVLNVFKRDALFQQIRDRGHAERVGRQAAG